MNTATRERVIAIAKKHGFVAQLKADGSDRYVKNLIARELKIKQNELNKLVTPEHIEMKRLLIQAKRKHYENKQRTH